MTDQPGESGRGASLDGDRPGTPTGYVAAVSGYALGVFVPPAVIGTALWINQFSEPDPVPDCFRDGSGFVFAGGCSLGSFSSWPWPDLC